MFFLPTFIRIYDTQCVFKVKFVLKISLTVSMKCDYVYTLLL